MTNIDIASALRQKGWKTELLIGGALRATSGNISLIRKDAHLKVVIQQHQIIKAEYRPESQPKQIDQFIEWILREIAALISFSLQIKGRERKTEKYVRDVAVKVPKDLKILEK